MCRTYTRGLSRMAYLSPNNVESEPSCNALVGGYKILCGVIIVDSNLQEAKKIFFAHHGMHFYMARGEIYDYYKSFNIPRRVEVSWLREMLSDILDKFHKTPNLKEKERLFTRYGKTVAQLKDEDELQCMMKHISSGKECYDTITISNMIGSLLNTVQSFSDSVKIPIINNEIIPLLKDILNGDVRISDDYKENGIFPDYCLEEKVREGLMNKITYWESKLL